MEGPFGLSLRPVWVLRPDPRRAQRRPAGEVLQPALHRVERESERVSGRRFSGARLVLMEQPLHKEKDGHVMIFKRPLPD